MSNKLKVLIVAILLIIISMAVILINGKTYTAKVYLSNVSNTTSVDELKIIIENDIVKCIDKKIENGFLLLNLESIKEGKTYIDINDKNDNFIETFPIYVHKSGIITDRYFFGNCTGSIIIPISIMILIGYIEFLLIKKFRKELNKNMYQYKNIAYLGLIIFLCFAFINQLLTIHKNEGLIHIIKTAIDSFSMFSMFLLPVAFVTAILVTISNIILVKKEGLNIRNLLGLILGLFFCLATIFPELLNDYLQRSTWIDVHKENGLARYIQEWVELMIYAGISYLESILIGTIILSIKAAKHIPKFNKDFMIILGCQIKKDGGLTNLLRSRVDRAIEFRNIQKNKTGKDLIFVPSGGQGSDEIIPEAHAIKNYLLENGINEENILVEEKSKNTYENIKFSKMLIDEKLENANIAFSTTNYHVFRAGNIANKEDICMEGIGAKTKRYFWINAFIREYIATLYSERKTHILTISSIMILSVLMMILLYFSNIL